MVALNLGEWDVKLSFLQELQVVCHATTVENNSHYVKTQGPDGKIFGNHLIISYTF